jgi:hypothetical protein
MSMIRSILSHGVEIRNLLDLMWSRSGPSSTFDQEEIVARLIESILHSCFLTSSVMIFDATYGVTEQMRSDDRFNKVSIA